MAIPPTTMEESLRGRYTVERELGRGGMAVVFLAHDLRHERVVALKVLHAELVPEHVAERFQREIKMAARLQHPHILTVLDSGELADGRLWYTMPYVEGETLRERLHRDGALPLEQALRFAREVADGLHYAHGPGVIHRDIKPENILLSGYSTREPDASSVHALIADFGIARALEETAPQSVETGNSLTQAGTVIASPTYMSPEQASGERALTGRVDQYALAVVVYEMLAGRPPFTGTTAYAVLAQHLLAERPGLRPERPSVPSPSRPRSSRRWLRCPTPVHDDGRVRPGTGAGLGGAIARTCDDRARGARGRPAFALGAGSWWLVRLIAHAGGFLNLFWVLDEEQQQLLLWLGPGAFDNDRGMWGLALAQTHALRGNAALARAYADSAVPSFERSVAGSPNDGLLRRLCAEPRARRTSRGSGARRRAGSHTRATATNGITGPIVQHYLVLALSRAW